MEYNSESDYDSDSNTSDSEMLNSNYVLGIASIYHPVLHGEDNNTSASVYGEYMFMAALYPQQYFNGEYKQQLTYLNDSLIRTMKRFNVANYEYVPFNDGKPQLCSLEIMKPRRLIPGGEYVSSLHTFWIRIFIRTAKKFVQKKKQTVKSILSGKRQITGRIK
tara:strand:- start:3154 stop:3642 length:489 start_codon:yes stop_codon:yes gene_type:complete